MIASFIVLDIRTSELIYVLGKLGFSKKVRFACTITLKFIPIYFAEKRRKEFRQLVLKIAGLILGLTVFSMGAAAVLGIPVLSILLGSAGKNLAPYTVALVLVILGGGFYAILNLMPVPPLDGSHILMNFLPLKWQIHIARFSMVSLLILIVILNSPIASHIFVPLQKSILGGFESIVNLVL